MDLVEGEIGYFIWREEQWGWNRRLLVEENLRVFVGFGWRLNFRKVGFEFIVIIKFLGIWQVISGYVMIECGIGEGRFQEGRGQGCNVRWVVLRLSIRIVSVFVFRFGKFLVGIFLFVVFLLCIFVVVIEFLNLNI